MRCKSSACHSAYEPIARNLNTARVFLCFALLREHNIAFVFADTAGKWPYTEDLTADLVYIRLHGAEQLYVSGYSDSALDWWANRIRQWRKGQQPRDAKVITKGKIDNDP